MKYKNKAKSKFKIEEVDSRVEFFFLSGILNQVFGASPYSHHSGSGDGFGWCDPQPKNCSTSSSYTSDGGGSFWGRW